MALYSAYFDDSGHPDDSLYVIVAGCIADVTQWVHFEREWLEALAPFNTKVFHAVDLEQGNRPFERLTQKQQTELLVLLVGIITRRIEKTFAHIVPMSIFNALNDQFVFAESVGFPFPFAARNCMADVEQWARYYSLDSSSIKYYFEDGSKHRGQLLWMVERDYLPTPLFPKKQEAVPLQAGDLIGWLLTQTLNGRLRTAHVPLLERIENHGAAWSMFTDDIGFAFVHFANITPRDPNTSYKCKILKANGKRVAAIQYWPKNSREPSIDRKTLSLQKASTPFSLYPTPENSPMVDALRKYHEGRQKAEAKLKPRA